MATVDGTVRFEAGGKDRALRFTTNALCLLEDKLDLSAMQIGNELQFGVSIVTLRGMFWAGLGDDEMTLAQAGEIIDAVGIKRAREIATEAFAAAFPDEEGDATSNEGPPKAAAG